MKTLFNLITTLVFLQINLSAQTGSGCNYALGSDGSSVSANSLIKIDGNMNDWSSYVDDPDNNSYDNTTTPTESRDMDYPIADAGRDLTKIVSTQKEDTLYLYVARAGSINNTIDVLFYMDINNNDLMELNEPVLQLNWGGSNGRVSMSLHNYIPALTLTDPNANRLSSNMDGKSLGGSLLYRQYLGIFGQGNTAGTAMEAFIPFSALTQTNALGSVIHQLRYGSNFRFHISTINGQVSSIPNKNAINDNFGGCITAPNLILPVYVSAFDVIRRENLVSLNWTITAEVSLSACFIERSLDGKNFETVKTVSVIQRKANDAHYNDVDINTHTAITYYRIKIISVDNRILYTAIRAVDPDQKRNSIGTISVYPNPATNMISVTMPGKWQNENVQVSVFDLSGNRVALKQFTYHGSVTNIDLSMMKQGIYIVQAICNDERLQGKIIKK